jgi:surface antigen
MRESVVIASLALAVSLSAAPAPAAAQGAGIGGLFACDAPGSNAAGGAVIGAIVGGLAGSQVAKNERTLGAVVGAGLGAVIGNSIGCRMNRQAQLNAQSAFERALETGQTQSWRDPETGAAGRIEVVGRGPRTGGWRYDDGIAPAQRLVGYGGSYEAAGRVNVRAAPSAQAAVVDRLQPGERIASVGSTPGGWLAVEEEGVVTGYVSAAAVRPLQGGGSAGAGGCRVVQQTITAAGYAPETQRYNACRDAAGGWRVSAI